jgi:hypothetical protein
MTPTTTPITIPIVLLPEFESAVPGFVVPCGSDEVACPEVAPGEIVVVEVGRVAVVEAGKMAAVVKVELSPKYV